MLDLPRREIFSYFMTGSLESLITKFALGKTPRSEHVWKYACLGSSISEGNLLKSLNRLSLL